jgi:hypothetical protein
MIGSRRLNIFMKSFRDYLRLVESKLIESAPPGKEAADWIRHRKADFKDRYGKRWRSVLYGAAWKRFPRSD